MNQPIAFTISNIALQSIDCNDKTFIITTTSDKKGLEGSIEKIGLLNPPILFLPPEKHSYKIICGYRRVAALFRLGWEQTPAKIVPSDIDKKTLFLISFYDNLAHRQYNPIELTMIIDRLLQYFAKEKIIKEFLPLLGLSPSAKTLHHFTTLARIETEVKEAVIRGTISETIALALAELDYKDRLALFELFSRLNVSFSKQKEILENCLDIAKRHSIAIKRILEMPDIKDIVEQNALTRRQRADRVRAWLKRKRFPLLTKRQEQFSQHVKKLQLPEEIKISHPPFFEGEVFNFQIAFKNIEDLRQKTTWIENLINNPSLRHILQQD